MNTPSIPQKQCTQCKCLFPATLEHFRIKKYGKYGLHSFCKTCENKRNLIYYRTHKLAAKERAKRYYTQNKERLNSGARKWQNNNRDKTRTYNQKHRRNHPEKIAEAQKRYFSSEHGKNVRKSHYVRWYTRKFNLPIDFTANDWEQCMKYFEYRCAVCGRPRGLWHTLAQDHWIAIKSPNCPGTIPSNIVPLCQGVEGCNQSKSNRDPMEWLTSTYGPRKAKQINKRIQEYFDKVRR